MSNMDIVSEIYLREVDCTYLLILINDMIDTENTLAILLKHYQVIQTTKLQKRPWRVLSITCLFICNVISRSTLLSGVFCAISLRYH